MTALPPLVLGTEESTKLQDHVKVELAQRRWSEGEDDEVMAEYILVMLANNKTSEQIAAELKELIGEGGEENNNQDSGVDDFVNWIWQERTRIRNGSDVKMESLSSGTSEAKSREQWRSDEARNGDQGRSNSVNRRSLSPQRRSNHTASNLPLRPVGQSERRGGDRWDDRHQGQHRDNVRQYPTNGRRELFDTEQRGGLPAAAMDDPSLGNERRGQASVRIMGRGGNNLFRKSIEQTRQQHVPQQSPQTTNQSIFSRVLMPDPRAAEFVPSFQPPTQIQESNLLSRLDPMMPNNPPPTSTSIFSDASTIVHESDFPTQPQDASLCRYSLGCTNPMCIFSHPSASAVAQSKKTGAEPLVLKQDPCRFQKDCTNVECPYSHISPAVTFVTAKQNKGGEGIINGGPAACHFQMECKNASCTYAHFDPKSGQLVPSPAANESVNPSNTNNKLDQALPSDLKSCRFGVHCTRKDCHFSHPAERDLHISDRLSRFGETQDDGEKEVIIPVA